jgi:hypothetical protein
MDRPVHSDFALVKVLCPKSFHPTPQQKKLQFSSLPACFLLLHLLTTKKTQHLGQKSKKNTDLGTHQFPDTFICHVTLGKLLSLTEPVFAAIKWSLKYLPHRTFGL